MPQKLFDADGNEIEAFTAEEVEASKKEALDAYMAEHPDQTEALTKLQADLAQANSDLEKATGAGMSEQQKQRLLEAKKEAEKKLTEFQETTMTQIKTLTDMVIGGPRKAMLEKLSGGNKELREKIEFAEKELAGEAKTPEEAVARLTKAYTLATGAAPRPGVLDNMAGTPGRGDHQTHTVGEVESDNSKAIRKNLGIPDAAVKEFEEAKKNNA